MKSKRHSKIVDIIKNYDIDTQEELAERLKSLGFDVTQATVSRDIRDLKLTKVQIEGGKQKYTVINNSVPKINERQIRVFIEGVISLEKAQNIMVIKTLTGMAMAVAASLDAMNHKEIVGTIAGDDTIFSVLKCEKDVIDLIDELRDIIGK